MLVEWRLRQNVTANLVRLALAEQLEPTDQVNGVIRADGYNGVHGHVRMYLIWSSS